jgi:hypothetical protein
VERDRLPKTARRGRAAARINYKDYILPPPFTKRLCDVFDDEINRIAHKVGSRKQAFQLAKADHKLVRFHLPLVPDDPEQPRQRASSRGCSLILWQSPHWISSALRPTDKSSHLRRH